MDDSPSDSTGLENRLTTEALHLLDAAGAEAVTIREVARRAGVSHGAPRRHFASRDELLSAVAEQCVLDLGYSVGDSSATDMATSFIDYAQRNPNRFALLTRHDLLAETGRGLRRRTLPLLDRWLSAYRKSIPRGTRTTGIAAFAGILGLAELAAHQGIELLGEPLPALVDAVLLNPRP